MEARYLEERRTRTRERTNDLRGKLTEAGELASGRACVYVTGSFGRVEAGAYSDLDVFIVGHTEGDQRALKKLDEICLKADLIKATRELGFPEFSGDGEYLSHYTVQDLVKTLGQSNDDASNTFTARLLLLLESRPLLGDDVYNDVIDQVIDAYWGDYEDHKNDFIPGFLTNDILRLWRTFCVNYEARTTKEPPRKKAKRKLKNYKLKHSRLLTCYSALAYLLAVLLQKETVSPSDAKTMTTLTPTERLESLANNFRWDSAQLARILSMYDEFLKITDVSEDELVERFLHREESKKLIGRAGKFGDEVAALLQDAGKSSPFNRLLIV